MPPKNKRGRGKSSDSYSSIELGIPPMSQHMPKKRYDNACHAATTGMVYNHFASQGFIRGDKKVSSVEDVKTHLYGKGKGKPTLGRTADIEHALKSAGMSSEGLGRLGKKSYKRPPLNGKESLLEKFHDRTPVPFVVSRDRAKAAGSAPITDGHYMLGVGASKSRSKLKYIDPADKKPNVREIDYRTDDEGKVNVSGVPHYIGAMYAAYPSEDWEPSSPPVRKKPMTAPTPAAAASIPQLRSRGTNRSDAGSRLPTFSPVDTAPRRSPRFSPPPHMVKTGGRVSQPLTPKPPSGGMPPRMQRRER